MKKNTQVVEALYLDLEDLKQSKYDREKEKKKKRERERESCTPFIKAYWVNQPPPTESDFWPTLPSRE